MKKFLIVAVSLAVIIGGLYACGSNKPSADSGSDNDNSSSNDSSEFTGDVPMQYQSTSDVKEALDNQDKFYLIVDVRKAADYQEGHVPGAINADMDAAKGGDTQSGKDNMKAALKEATDSETGADKIIVLVCYSGAAYAQTGTNVLSNLGAAMSNVYTLEGGMKSWTADYADDIEK